MKTASFRPIRSTFRATAIAAASIFFLVVVAAFQSSATSFLFNNGSAWLTGANWTPAGPPGTNDIAQFGTTLPSKGNGLALNCDKPPSSFNNGPTNEAVGAIQVLPTRSSDFAMGNSSSAGTNGFITFNGATINGIANVIIENASPQTFTVQNTNASGITTVLMGMVLANPTENIILLDGTGAITISDILSSVGGSTPLTFTSTNTVAGVGKITISGTANTFSGSIKIGNGVTNAPEVPFASVGSIGDPTNTVTVDGGRFTLSGSTDISSHPVFFGATPGTSVSVTGTGVVTNNGVMADKPGSTGVFVKQGGGTLKLGGVSTFTGSISLNNGVVQLTTGDNRLPTNAAVNIGQAGSSNTGTLDLSGENQTIAGLNSTSGITNTTRNLVTNSTGTPVTLTLGGAAAYNYGDATATNSGIIAGPIALVMNGSGTQTLGDANTYTGGTTINAGRLMINNTTGSGTGSGNVTVAGGTLSGSGIIQGAITVATNGTLVAGRGAGDTSTLTINNSLNLSGAAVFFLNRTNGQNSSRIAGLSNVSYGGTLVVSNLADAPQSGDTFTLFAAATNSGAFTTTLFPTLAGSLQWNWNPTNGQLSVSSTASTNVPPSLLTSPTVLGNGTFRFGFTNVTGASFTVFASTNITTPLNTWSNLGAAIESPSGSGQFNFIDAQATNKTQRFYNVRSP